MLTILDFNLHPKNGRDRDFQERDERDTINLNARVINFTESIDHTVEDVHMFVAVFRDAVTIESWRGTFIIRSENKWLH